jgi:hypothetical protein
MSILGDWGILDTLLPKLMSGGIRVNEINATRKVA